MPIWARVRTRKALRGMSSVVVVLLGIAFANPAAAKEARSDAMRSPLSNYMLMCQGCHSPKGAGLRDQVPAFRDEVSKFLSINGGREYLIQVPGVSKSPLSDQATADLMNWLFFQFDATHVPDNFEPYTEEEVAQLRKSSISNATQIREYLLSNKIPVTRNEQTYLSP